MSIRAARVGWIGLLLFSASLCFGQEEVSPQSVHYRFREPHATGYRVERSPSSASMPRLASLPQRVTAWPDNGSTNYVQFGSRTVLQLKDAADLTRVLQGRSLTVSRRVAERVFILQAPDVETALREAQSLAEDPRVAASYPVTFRPKQLLGRYAPRPNDPLFFVPGTLQGEWQAHLENRNTNGLRLGVDLNVREAWAITRGEGVVLAIADDGFETDHPDLRNRAEGAPHFNFITERPDGMPSGIFSSHATAVAGIAGATSDNKLGVAGVAPRVQLASWVIFGANDNLVSEEALMDMFQYQSNVVSVQNHSWGKVGAEQLRVSSLEDLALQNAIDFGRSGLGTIFVRAAGNGREEGTDANEDGYLADPRVIAVAAARLDGRFTRYSSPGACILVAAPSGDLNETVADPCLSDTPNITTTDRRGSRGYNRAADGSHGGDYAWGADGFSGTSAATPQISGVAALILSVNPELTYRDVQQILLLSSRPHDFSDPTLVVNGAGLQVSHNVGFGVPDAGRAVSLARDWANRPGLTSVSYQSTDVAAIPDDGLRVGVEGTDVPDFLRSLAALPGSGIHPESNTALIPVTDVGSATEPITADLRGRAALIQRAPNFFCQKIAFAAQAGAELVIIYNNTGGTDRIFMVETDRTPIPSVFISQNDGEALRDFVAAQPDARVQLTVNAIRFTFDVTETLQCEFVAVHLDTDHSARGDLRVVLTSPSGTRSVLQRVNRDTLPGPRDWTFYSVQHFYESSFGRWTVSISDENDQGTGSVQEVRLTLTGVSLQDSDHDGLEDAWELEHFGTLSRGAADDPDADGYSNAREQVTRTDPNGLDSPLALDLSLWDSRLARLSWPSVTNTVYRVQIGSDSPRPLSLLTNVPGRPGQTEWFVPYTNVLHEFFRVQAVVPGH